MNWDRVRRERSGSSQEFDGGLGSSNVDPRAFKYIRSELGDRIDRKYPPLKRTRRQDGASKRKKRWKRRSTPWKRRDRRIVCAFCDSEIAKLGDSPDKVLRHYRSRHNDVTKAQLASLLKRMRTERYKDQRLPQDVQRRIRQLLPRQTSTDIDVSNVRSIRRAGAAWKRFGEDE